MDDGSEHAKITAALRLISRSEGRCLECLGLEGIPEERVLRACWHEGDELPRYRLLQRVCEKCGKRARILRRLRHR